MGERTKRGRDRDQNRIWQSKSEWDTEKLDRNKSRSGDGGGEKKEGKRIKDDKEQNFH